MSEKFSLKWNEFHSNVSKCFVSLRNEEYLQDVTLVSDDHSKVQAHKLVLSVCSDYFRDILKNNPHTHPLICIEGASLEDLKNIMDYIYNGEVQVYRDSLDRFITIAQRLKLGGIISDNADDDIFSTIDEIKDDVESSYENKRAQKHEKKTKFQESEIKVENSSVSKLVSIDSQDPNEINEKIREYLEECSDGSYKCSLCGKTSGGNFPKSIKRQIIQRHIETHIDGLTYACPICPKICSTSNALTKHKSRYHK